MTRRPPERLDNALHRWCVPAERSGPAPRDVLATMHVMTDAHAPAGPSTSSADGIHRVRVLLYSDDITTRDAVRAAAGRRPARDVEVASWQECATAEAVIEAMDAGGFDVVVLDGEAAPVGGLGLCRQLKNEIFRCPPILVLIGRPQDAWLAGWSLADDAVPHPLDPIAVAEAVAGLARGRATVG